MLETIERERTGPYVMFDKMGCRIEINFSRGSDATVAGSLNAAAAQELIFALEVALREIEVNQGEIA